MYVVASPAALFMSMDAFTSDRSVARVDEDEVDLKTLCCEAVPDPSLQVIHPT